MVRFQLRVLTRVPIRLRREEGKRLGKVRAFFPRRMNYHFPGVIRNARGIRDRFRGVIVAAREPYATHSNALKAAKINRRGNTMNVILRPSPAMDDIT